MMPSFLTRKMASSYLPFGSHVGQLTRISLYVMVNDLRIIDDARIGYEEAGDGQFSAWMAFL